MKCQLCGKNPSEFMNGYCLRCEKMSVDDQDEQAVGGPRTIGIGKTVRGERP